MRPEVDDYLKRKFRRASVLGDAREDIEPEGMAPEELEQYEPRQPIVPVEPPMVDVDEVDPDVAALERAQEQDRDARLDAGMTNASKKAGSAITGGIYRPDYVKPELGAVSAEQDRQKVVQDYLLRKRAGDTNAMNAEAALLNARRERKATEPKADPLIEEKREHIKAQTAKALRAPVAKPPKAGRNPNEGLPEGYESSPENPASEDNKKRFTARVDNMEKMRGLTDAMRAALAEASRFGKSIPGPVQTKIAGLAKKIQIETKNVAELGALSGPDMGLVEGIIADPTSIANVLKDVPGQLDGLDAWAENGVRAGLKAYGVRKKGAQQAISNDEHAQALAWAKAHPNDPDAQEILRLHGAK